MAESDAPPVAAFAKLALRRRWVAWRLEPSPKDGRLTKVPYGVRGKKASSTEPATWLYYAEAQTLAATFAAQQATAGIGVHLGEVRDEWCLVGVDLDVAMDGCGTLALWAAEILERFGGTYMEASPSGRGVHVLFRLHAEEVARVRAMLGGKQSRSWKQPAAKGEKAPGAELHLGGYYTITFDPLADSADAIRPVPLESLLWLIEKAGPALRGTATPHGGAAPRGPGHLRIRPSSLEALALMGDLEVQVGLAYAAGSGAQRRTMCPSITPPWLRKLPGRNVASTRGTRHIVGGRKALVEAGRLRLLEKSERRKGNRLGRAATYDLPWLHAVNDAGPSPRIRWNRLALRKLLLALRPAEMRLLALLVSRHGLAGAEPFALSARALARECGGDKREALSAIEGLARAGLIVPEVQARQGRCGLFRLGPWNGEGEPLPSISSTGITGVPLPHQ